MPLFSFRLTSYLIGMVNESHGSNPSNESNGSSQRSTAENIRELTAASKQLLEAGRQMTDNLTELSQRVEHAGTIGSQILKSPWLVVGGTITAGILLLVFSRKH